MNDIEREQWVNNDEGLYAWWQSSRLSMREFVRENRAELTACIQAAGRQYRQDRLIDSEPLARYDWTGRLRSRPLY